MRAHRAEDECDDNSPCVVLSCGTRARRCCSSVLLGDEGVVIGSGRLEFYGEAFVSDIKTSLEYNRLYRCWLR